MGQKYILKGTIVYHLYMWGGVSNSYFSCFPPLWHMCYYRQKREEYGYMCCAGYDIIDCSFNDDKRIKLIIYAPSM